jgi:hypothetical protein
MGIHHQQIRAAPQRPVALADRDVAVLIAVLAVLEGEVLSGEASPHMTRHLSDRLARYELLSPDAVSEGAGQGAERHEPATAGCPRGVRRSAVDALVAGRPAKPATKPSITQKREPRVTGGNRSARHCLW